MPRGIFPRVTPEDRFWAKVNKTSKCWLWIGRLDRLGYARFKIDGVATSIHRFAYQLLIGPIPVGLTLDHLCRVRHCVNPAHLEPVTQRDNTLRGETLNATNIKKTHCSRNHPYDLINTYWRHNDGGRDCRKCMIIRQREYRHRKHLRLQS